MSTLCYCTSRDCTPARPSIIIPRSKMLESNKKKQKVSQTMPFFRKRWRALVFLFIPQLLVLSGVLLSEPVVAVDTAVTSPSGQRLFQSRKQHDWQVLEGEPDRLRRRSRRAGLIIHVAAACRTLGYCGSCRNIAKDAAVSKHTAVPVPVYINMEACFPTNGVFSFYFPSSRAAAAPLFNPFLHQKVHSANKLHYQWDANKLAIQHHASGLLKCPGDERTHSYGRSK